DDLSRKLIRLQLLIDEGETNKRKVNDLKANLYTCDCKIATLENTIKGLTNEKEEILDTDYTDRLHKQAIERARISSHNEYLRATTYSQQLTRNEQRKVDDLKANLYTYDLDAEHTDRLHKQAIERARISSHNKYLRATTYSFSNHTRPTPVLHLTVSQLNLEEPEPLPAHIQEQLALLDHFLYVPEDNEENDEC
ncbi:45157_t:CDS:2, partial [Gigaspora margarita]